MKINTTYASNNNSYPSNNIKAIVIHNTDNFNNTADALAHAKAQYNGNFQNMSAHLYVDDKSAYQALPYNRGAWHIGVNYGGNNLFGLYSNNNTIAIEMCVNSGYNYSNALVNTADVCKQLMKQYNIDANHVFQHYDICSKNCPSQIRKRSDWDTFKELIGMKTTESKDKLYRVINGKQLGAFAVLSNALDLCKSTKGSFIKYQGDLSMYEQKKLPASVKITIKTFIYRSPSATPIINGDCGVGTYTITKEKAAGNHIFGKLKSGAGWIIIDYLKFNK